MNLYRCSQCRNLVGAVFEPLGLCRACKTGDRGAGNPEPVKNLSDIKIIENPDGSVVALQPGMKPEFFAMDEDFGLMTKAAQIAQLNNLTEQVAQRYGITMGFDPATGDDEATFTIVPGDRVQFKNETGEIVSAVYENLNAEIAIGKLRDGKLYFNVPLRRIRNDSSIDMCDIIDPSEVGLRFDTVPTRRERPEPEKVSLTELLDKEPAPSPVDAILNPRRKMRLRE